eukprot:scaffold137267_cov112-Phaeocystis_antarctica.AAC.1
MLAHEVAERSSDPEIKHKQVEEDDNRQPASKGDATSVLCKRSTQNLDRCSPLEKKRVMITSGTGQ